MHSKLCLKIYICTSSKCLKKSPHKLITKKVGDENMRKAINPPIQENVEYIDREITSWVDVGPGKDWQRVNNYINLSLDILW